MGRLLRRTGRIFVIFNQKEADDLRQSILLVDESSITANNFLLIINSAREKFKNANFTILTFPDRQEFIRDNFPDVKIIFPHHKLKFKRYQFVLKLVFLVRGAFKIIILPSLDIYTVFVSLIFGRCPVFLNNRWLQWYRIKYRTVLDILLGVSSSDRSRRRINRGIKDVLKKLGRIFVILTDINGRDTQFPVLIVDNGYTDIGHVSTAVRKVAKNFTNPFITVLTFAPRKHDFVSMFPHIDIVTVRNTHSRYGLAIEMYRMRKRGFNRIVLTTLDITPAVASLLFMGAEVFIYNRWHEWWRLSLRSLFGYLKAVWLILLMIPIALYLFLTACIILLRTAFRLVILNSNYNTEK